MGSNTTSHTTEATPKDKDNKTTTATSKATLIHFHEINLHKTQPIRSLIPEFSLKQPSNNTQ